MSKLIHKSYFPILCWLTATLIYMLTYGLLVIPELIVHQLKEEFQVGLSAIGFYSASFLYAWIIMQIPAGIMFDHYDSRKLMFVSTLVIVVACMMQYFSHGFAMGILSRMLMGGASSFSLIGAIYLGRAWFSVAVLPVIIGITQSMSGFTEVGFPILFARLSYQQIDWKSIIGYMGIVLCILAFLSLLFVRDDPHEVRIKKRRSALHALVQLKIIFGNKYLWGLGVYIGFGIAYFISFADMWGVELFKRQFDLDTINAVYLNSVIVVGFMLGSPIIGWMSRYMARRILMLICMLLEYLLLTLMDYFVFSVEGQIIGLFFMGFFTGAVVLAFDMTKEIISEEHYGLAVGFLNIFFSLIGVVLTPLMGYGLTLASGENIYEPLMLQVTTAIAAIMSIFIAWCYKFDTRKGYDKK